MNLTCLLFITPFFYLFNVSLNSYSNISIINYWEKIGGDKKIVNNILLASNYLVLLQTKLEINIQSHPLILLEIEVQAFVWKKGSESIHSIIGTVILYAIL